MQWQSMCAGEMHDAAEVLPTLLDSMCSSQEGHELVDSIFSISLEVRPAMLCV